MVVVVVWMNVGVSLMSADVCVCVCVCVQMPGLVLPDGGGQGVSKLQCRRAEDGMESVNEEDIHLWCQKVLPW